MRPLRAWIAIVLALGAVAVAPAAARADSDVPLSTGWATDGTVNAVWVDDSGRTYLGGSFTQVGARTENGLKLTTTSDQADLSFPDFYFEDPTGNNLHDGQVTATVPDGSGGWFVGGSFNFVGDGDVPRNYLAHILSDGSVDPTWNPSPSSFVNALARSGSDLYVGGEFATIGGQSRRFIAKLSTSGTGAADPDWNPNPNRIVNALAVSGTDVYAGGGFTTIGGQSRNRIAKLSSSGTGAADPTWDPNADSFNGVRALAVSGTDVYAGGDFTTMNGSTTRNHLAKIPTSGDGTVDPNWDPNANGAVNALAVSGTDVYAGGGFTTINGSTTRNRLAEIPASGDGTVDPDWDPNANSTVRALAVSGTDVYAGGDFTTLNGSTTRNHLAKIPASGDGTADPSWDPNTNGPIDFNEGAVSALAISGTDVYAGGSFTQANLTTRNGLARLSADGTLDASWDPDPQFELAGDLFPGIVTALAVSGSDVYVGGAFTQIGGQSRFRFAKLSSSGSGAADPTWDPGASVSPANSSVNALAVSGTDVYAGGTFTSIGGQSRNRIAKLSSSGTGAADPDWDPNADNAVNALAVSGSDVYAGGTFSQIGGQSRIGIAKLSSSGTGAADPTWNPGFNGNVRALAVSGTDVYVGGIFSNMGGQSRNDLAKLSSSGSGDADPTWDPSPDQPVNALAVSGTDVYAGGTFTSIGGQSRNRIARLSSSGTGAADPDWDPNADNTVNALAVSGTRLAAGGSFTTMGRVPGTAPAHANEGIALFTLNAAPTITTSTAPDTSLGDPVHDTATLAGGDNPAGRITFRLYRRDDATCSGHTAYTKRVAVSGNGDYGSGDFTPPRRGTYRWTASYSGDANNDPAATACNDPGETVTVGPAAPTLTTTASPDTTLGNPISDTATLAGGHNPEGRITFRLYGRHDTTCSNSPGYTKRVAVSGNGDYGSGDFTPTRRGTYRWTATYSGDSNNDPAATACNDPGESVTVS